MSVETPFNTATGNIPAQEQRRREHRTEREKSFFEDKAAAYRADVHSKQLHARLDLERRHALQSDKLERELKDAYGKSKKQDMKDLRDIQKGRNPAAMSNDERRQAADLRRNLANIKWRENEQKEALKTKQQEDIKKFDKAYQQEKEKAERAINAARQQRQANGWKPAPVVFQAKDEELSFQKPAFEQEAPSTAATTSSSAPTPTLAPKGARTGNLKPSQDIKQAVGRGAGRDTDFGL